MRCDVSEKERCGETSKKRLGGTYNKADVVHIINELSEVNDNRIAFLSNDDH